MHISTLQFVAALLLTLMLLWHISTVTLVEKYYMPQWWHDDFMAELQEGWRTAVWVVVLSMVPIDCAHALLCLDWWCLLRYGRDDGYETAADTVGWKRSADEERDATYMSKPKLERSRNRSDRATDASTPSRLSLNSSPSSTVRTSTPSAPYTYHPLLLRRFSPRTQSTLLSIFDLAMLAILSGHIISYFVSLPQYFSHCNTASVIAAPDFLFGDTGKLLNVRQGCIKLNVDIHVAGGFSTFLAIVLGALHGASLMVRGWEYVRLGRKRRGRVGEECATANPNVDEHGGVSRESGLEDPNLGSISALPGKSGGMTAGPPGSSASTTAVHTSRSSGNEERGTGVRFVDWSAERAEHRERRRGRGTEMSELDGEGSKWSEALLECLTDA